MALSSNTDTIIDSGSATTDISVVRRFMRKKKSTIITKSAPSSRLRCRLLMELSIKSLWRKMSVETRTSAGSVAPIEARASSISSVSCMVPVPGCLVTVIITAGSASTLATPIRGRRPPSSTEAMSPSVTVPPASERTTACAIASQSEVLISALTMYSFPY